MGAKSILSLAAALVISFVGLSYYVRLSSPSLPSEHTLPVERTATHPGARYPVPHQGRWGFMDESGRLVVPARFQMVSEFHEGLAAVQINDRWGFINAKGEMVIPARFQNVSDFHEGLCTVVVDPAVAEYPGYIDRTGTFAVRVEGAEYLGEYSEGFAVIGTGGKYGFLDKSGNVAIAPQFDAAASFSEGLARIAYKVGEGFKWGFVNSSGNVAIPVQFDDAGDFSEGLSGVRVGDVSGYIDTSGNFRILPQFEYAGDFKEGLAPVVQVKFGYIDASGQIVIAPDFDMAHEFREGMARIEVDNEQSGPLVGFINKEGQVVIEPQFESAMSFHGGLAVVRVRDQIGYIDKTGKYIWQPCESCNKAQ